MRMMILISSVTIAGCDGEETRPIPRWSDTELQGDCSDDTLYSEPFTSRLLESTNLDLADGAVSAGFGAVITDKESFSELYRTLDPDAPGAKIDFAAYQVGAVWLEACRIEIATVELLRKADDSLVLDVEFVDSSKNCEYDCFGLAQAAVLVTFPNEEPATVCRRVRAGCSP